MKDNLKNSIQNAMNRDKDTPTFDSTRQSEQEEISDSLVTEETTQQITNATDDTDQAKKKAEKPLITFGIICIILFFICLGFFPSTGVDTSEAAKNALTDKLSTSLSAGTVLLRADESIGEQDYTITHQSDNDKTKIWVWDYAAEDGDYVQVLVNEAPLSDAFMIKHKPVELVVPAVGNVQIKGIRDGGGGITYAVRYDLNGTNYFNSAPEGNYNTYTLIRE